MAAPNNFDRQTFLAHLRQSELLSAEQLARISSGYPDKTTARSLAVALVEDGILTRFQAERLFQGRHSGFVLGQYRILEELGRGGMGRVYKAEHRTMKRVVALKVLSADLLETARAVELFLHEVRAVSRLVHPNIVTAFDANEIGGRYYLVLEYVDGPNLEQLVRKRGPLPVGLACDYIRQAAVGLQCAHLVGMVHRDIKPANILVQWQGMAGDGSPGLVKISDFGLARLAHPVAGDNAPRGTILTKENTVMGTPDYLSPEQARSLRKTDIRSDIYSLGCTFYFLLTGEVPFPGGTQIDKLIRHATQEPVPVTSRRTDVPPQVAAILAKMMAKQPEARFATPADLAEALAPFAVSGPTPWAKPRPQQPEAFAEGAAAPSDSDLAAMTATVGDDGSPTPLVFSPRRRPRQAESHLRTALITAVCIVGGSILIALILALVGRLF